MIQEGQNEYEPAFEGRLGDAGVRFARVDQTHRCVVADEAVKTFDYVVYPRRGGCVLVELKGRVFEGESLAGRRRLQCWVQGEDVEALGRWQRRFAREEAEVEAVFVFAYRLAKMAVDEDGLAVYDCGRRRYVFLAVRLEDYRRCMRRRSVRWKTVCLSAADFRSLCFPVEEIWDKKQSLDECDNTGGGSDDSGRRAVDGRGGRAFVGGVGGGAG